MTNKTVARALKHTAALVELTGGNPFRGRAFASAARLIDGLDESAAALAAEGRLAEVPGIGKGIATDVAALVQTGSFETLDALQESLPPGLLDVLRVKGLGPKRARRLWQELGVTSLDDLEAAALAGRIAALSGFGKKTEEKLLAEAGRVREHLRRRRYHQAVALAAPVLDALRAADGIERAEPAGALRRRCEVMREIELVVAADADALRAALSEHAAETEGGTDRSGAFFTGTLPDGFPLVVHRAEAGDFGRAWWRRTGSAAHVAAFAGRFGEPDAAAEEGDVYHRAGLPPIEPELREGDGELDAAEAGAPPRLITTDDLRGTIHNHSTYSDGAHTLREMAEAARGMGYDYFGICDHSRSLTIAHGLSVEELMAQAEEVETLNREYAGTGFRVFHGSEVDILADGALDYPDDVLEKLDLVVASVHTHFGMTEAEATERLVRAVSHPQTDVLGHLTGRLLLRRDGYPVDHDAVIAACAEHGVAIELNANPHRLDVDWRHLRRATAAGVLISINPDAHSVDGLLDVQWGVAAARKGWLTPAQCLNAKGLDAFAAWLGSRKKERKKG